jgi:hypothetical protein
MFLNFTLVGSINATFTNKLKESSIQRMLVSVYDLSSFHLLHKDYGGKPWYLTVTEKLGLRRVLG